MNLKIAPYLLRSDFFIVRHLDCNMEFGRSFAFFSQFRFILPKVLTQVSHLFYLNELHVNKKTLFGVNK